MAIKPRKSAIEVEDMVRFLQMVGSSSTWESTKENGRQWRYSYYQGELFGMND